MHLLIVDEENPQRVLRLTVTVGETGPLVRGDLDVEELRAEDLFDLLQTQPAERTVIVRSAALQAKKEKTTTAQKLSLLGGL